MKNLFLGLAFASLALVSCETTSNNNMEAANAPVAATCAMGSTCDMDSSGCEDMAAKECDMGAEECDMAAKECDMGTEECDMGAKSEGGETCDMDAAAAKTCTMSEN
jgi:hypothetical protein